MSDLSPEMQMQCHRVCDVYVRTMVGLITEMFKAMPGDDAIAEDYRNEQKGAL